MNKEKALLENLITSKKNIKRKIMEMKRGIIDSDNYYREVFKPITEPLSLQTKKKNNQCSLPSVDDIETETYCTTNKNNDNELNSSFANFFNENPKLKHYDKSYGLHYDTATDSYKIGDYPITFNHGNLKLFNEYYPWTVGLWSLLCEKEPKNTTIEDMESYYNILKTSRVHLKADGKPKTSKFPKWITVVKPLYERMKYEEKQLNEDIAKINRSISPGINLKRKSENVSSSSNKRSNIHDNTTITNESFNFNPTETSSMTTDPLIGKMFDFTSPSQPKKGDGLYKDVIPQTQLVYYDDPNELVTRLNLLTSSKSVGNTGVNNEIISILEELRERNIIV